VLNLAPAQAIPLEILRQLTVLILNETEACFLCDYLNGRKTQTLQISNEEDAAWTAHSLQGWGIPNVIITLGSKGAVLAQQGNTCHIAAPSVQVVDTTAAGDCFTGAFTVALVNGESPQKSLQYAVYASALKVTKFGAQSGLPTSDEAETFLLQNMHEGKI
jgi:ribokinase